jgi:uncharacterized protein with FMN-binding domain
MKRAPIVIATTAAGLAGVLAFHTSPAPLTLGTAPGLRGTTGTGGTGGTGTTGNSGTSTTTGPPGQPTTSTTSPPKGSAPSTTAPSSGTRTATGNLVNYNYGELSVKVTVSGRKITNVTISSINDGGNFRSQSIDQQSIPILEQQALQAQSANIQGVAGATYTSSGFAQSLQSALSHLGL